MLKNKTDIESLISAGFAAPWWKDGREKNCAYCGVMMRQRGQMQVPTKATADHIIPLCEAGPAITIPSCRSCNEAKGAQSLPAFLQSDHFKKIRLKKHGKAWLEHELWAVHSVASLRKTYELMSKL